MQLEYIKNYFKKSYINNHFTIYPLLTNNNDNDYGTYDIPFNIYNKILNLLCKNYTSKKFTQYYYQYNDMELIKKIINGDDDCKSYSSKNFVEQFIENNCLTNIFTIKKIDPECFPILNKYNNEVIQEISEFYMDKIKLILCKESDKYYFYISFYYHPDNLKYILNDIKSIQNIINIISKNI